MDSAENDGRVGRLARQLWDYLRVGEELEPADAILVFGSRDVRPGAWGARLFLRGLAPLLIVSGGRGRYTLDWPRSEAAVLKAEALRLGVPEERILLEDRSTNTGENVAFTRRLVEERGLDIRRLILVHVPFMERRVLVTLEKAWPGAAARASSPPITLEECFTPEIGRDFVIRRLCGEVARMVEYPQRGFQAPQDVPAAVIDAWRELEGLGYEGDLGPFARVLRSAPGDTPRAD